MNGVTAVSKITNFFLKIILEYPNILRVSGKPQATLSKKNPSMCFNLFIESNFSQVLLEKGNEISQSCNVKCHLPITEIV